MCVSAVSVVSRVISMQFWVRILTLAAVEKNVTNSRVCEKIESATNFFVCANTLAFAFLHAHWKQVALSPSSKRVKKSHRTADKVSACYVSLIKFYDRWTFNRSSNYRILHGFALTNTWALITQCVVRFLLSLSLITEGKGNFSAWLQVKIK